MDTRSGSQRSGFLPARVVHLHPSRFCNLACKHCYSESGPTVRGEIALDVILPALEVLRREGYEVLSLSGGEPLLYSGLEALMQGAAGLGFQINLISNGAPVGGRLLNLVADYAALIAISLDGGPETHADLRGDPNAFTRAERALDRLAEKGVHFGLAYGVSRESLRDMPWAVDFARQKGAELVQFHPFAAVGRGRFLADRLGLSETDKARAYLVASLLETDEDPKIHIDLAPVEAARERRGDYTILQLEDASERTLSDLINPLVIDETGQVSPYTYGIDRRLNIGRIGPDFSGLIAQYKADRWRDLRLVIEDAFDRLGMRGEQFVDWFFHVVETSYRPQGQAA